MVDNVRSQESNLDVRRARRRSDLLEAGVALLGAAGGPAVSVRAVCTAAGLTERYFYQSFGDRDSFVRAVYEHVARSAHAALVEAASGSDHPATEAADTVGVQRARRVVTAFVESMVDYPVRGRVLLIAPFADQALSTIGPTTVPVFVDLVGQNLPDGMDGVDRALVATSVVGALTGLFTAYLRGELTVDRDRFVAHCIAVLVDGRPAPREGTAAR